MGQNADLVAKHFAGPLGLAPWHPLLDESGKPMMGGWGASKAPIVIPGIRNEHVREFVLGAADCCCSDYFWTRPASISGFHPAVSAGDGGLVRHTWYACYWGTQFARAMDLDRNGSPLLDDTAVTPNHDAILAALILHDMMKDGDPYKVNEPERRGKNSKRYILGIHGVDMAEAVYTRFMQRNSPTRWQLFVLRAIAGHMGPWTGPPQWRPIPANFKTADGGIDWECLTVAQVVFNADYASSRKVDNVMASIAKAGIGSVLTDAPNATTRQAA